jgi:hypothetical protein
MKILASISWEHPVGTQVSMQKGQALGARFMWEWLSKTTKKHFKEKDNAKSLLKTPKYDSNTWLWYLRSGSNLFLTLDSCSLIIWGWRCTTWQTLRAIWYPSQACPRKGNPPPKHEWPHFGRDLRRLKVSFTSTIYPEAPIPMYQCIPKLGTLAACFKICTTWLSDGSGLGYGRAIHDHKLSVRKESYNLWFMRVIFLTVTIKMKTMQALKNNGWFVLATVFTVPNVH